MLLNIILMDYRFLPVNTFDFLVYLLAINNGLSLLCYPPSMVDDALLWDSEGLSINSF